jgi:hypothetical protein
MENIDFDWLDGNYALNYGTLAMIADTKALTLAGKKRKEGLMVQDSGVNRQFCLCA